MHHVFVLIHEFGFILLLYFYIGVHLAFKLSLHCYE